MSYDVVCLADHFDLLDQCIDLLNSQWPRSRSSRQRSLEQTKQGSFPTSLLLLQKSSNKVAEVIGHSKILPVPHREDACFVESVVITSSLRGLGLGRLIMEETENFVKKKGIRTIHLTTHDQQGFYEKLGYNLSDPVIIYGGISPNLQKLIENNEQRIDGEISESVSRNTIQCKESNPGPQKVTTPLGGPPPPPPPIPKSVTISSDLGKKVYMAKSL